MAQLAAVLLDTQAVTLTRSARWTSPASRRSWPAPPPTPPRGQRRKHDRGLGRPGFSTAETVDATRTLYPIDLVNLAGGVIDATGPNYFQFIGTSFVPPQSLQLASGNDIILNSGLIEGTEPGGLLLLAGAIDQVRRRRDPTADRQWRRGLRR